MTHAAAAADLALIDGIEPAALAGADPRADEPTLDRAARACRTTLQAALDRRAAGALTAADLLSVVRDLERRCRGNRDLLVLLLRRGGAPEAAIPEMWFEVGRAAAEAGDLALTAELGDLLVAASRDTRPDAIATGRPSPLARGLHLRMLTAVFPESRAIAKQAKKAYVRTKCMAPADVWARFKAPAAPAAPGAAAGTGDDDADGADGADGDGGASDAPTQAAAATAPRTPKKPSPSQSPTPTAPRPVVPAEGTLTMQELVALLRAAGETKIGGAEISRHAVRARLRHPADAPPEYADLAQMRNPETGRFPRAAALEIVERIARRVRGAGDDLPPLGD